METKPDSNSTKPTPSVTGQPPPPWVTQPTAPAATEAQAVSFSPTAPVQPEEPATQPVVKKSPFGVIVPLLIFVLLGLGIFLLVTKVFLPLINKTSQEAPGDGQTTDNGEKITLTWWGLWEAETIVKPLIEDYQKIILKRRLFINSNLTKTTGKDCSQLWLKMKVRIFSVYTNPGYLC